MGLFLTLFVLVFFSTKIGLAPNVHQYLQLIWGFETRFAARLFWIRSHPGFLTLLALVFFCTKIALVPNIQINLQQYLHQDLQLDLLLNFKLYLSKPDLQQDCFQFFSSGLYNLFNTRCIFLQQNCNWSNFIVI